MIRQYIRRSCQAVGGFVAARRLHVGYHRKGAADVPVVVLLHGLGCTHEVWEDTIKKLPGNVSIVAVDLLGFGKSPRPWLPIHHNYVHARSVLRTLKKLGYHKDIIFVGHSLGGLVAIEAARQRPRICQRLLLCGPPIYRNRYTPHDTASQEAKILTSLYTITAQVLEGDKEAAVVAAKAITATGLAPKAVEINQQTITPYILALRHSIIRQTSFADLASLTVPTVIIYGFFDPLLVHDTMQQLARHQHITAKRILASHELTRGYVRQICKRIGDEK